MKTQRLKVVSFGSASALTRDLICGPYMELNLWCGRQPVG